MQQQQQKQLNSYILQPGTDKDKDNSGTISGMLADFSRSIGEYPGIKLIVHINSLPILNLLFMTLFLYLMANEIFISIIITH